jgi:hypothetical protein
MTGRADCEGGALQVCGDDRCIFTLAKRWDFPKQLASRWFLGFPATEVCICRAAAVSANQEPPLPPGLTSQEKKTIKQRFFGECDKMFSRP